MRVFWRRAGDWALLSSALQTRVLLFALLSFGLIYLAFSFFEIPLWRCPWRALTGWRCPGCGLTEGCKSFLRGDFTAGISVNWLTPFVVLGLIMLPVILALPVRWRSPFLKSLELVERRLRLTLLSFLFLGFHIFARLLGWA